MKLGMQGYALRAVLWITLVLAVACTDHPAEPPDPIAEPQSASASSDAGNPLALQLFNVGVEQGQLGFIGVVALPEAVFKRYNSQVLQWARLVPAYLLGSVAAYWTIEPTVGFWS